MTTGASKLPANPLVRALARWENEGGSAQLPTDFDHGAILQHLGTAVLMRWNGLPREVQSDLFEAAAELDEPNASPEIARQHIAIFLHQHKNDERRADRGGEA